jgi:hypothetical protein
MTYSPAHSCSSFFSPASLLVLLQCTSMSLSLKQTCFVCTRSPPRDSIPLHRLYLRLFRCSLTMLIDVITCWSLIRIQKCCRSKLNGTVLSSVAFVLLTFGNRSILKAPYCNILGYHRDQFEEHCVSACDVMQSGRDSPNIS